MSQEQTEPEETVVEVVALAKHDRDGKPTVHFGVQEPVDEIEPLGQVDFDAADVYETWSGLVSGYLEGTPRTAIPPAGEPQGYRILGKLWLTEENALLRSRFDAEVHEQVFPAKGDGTVILSPALDDASQSESP